MKVIAINCSPRKNWNTSRLLKSAIEGAKASDAQVEYIDLYDLNFTGCRSCMLCKKKGVERPRCYWKDDLSQVIDKVFEADLLLIGSPIYLGRPSSHYFAFIERLHFCSLSYDDYSNYFKGKVNILMFITMNANQEFYENLYREKFEAYANELKFLNGETSIYPVYNTLQVNDYSKFDMKNFNEEDKKKVHEEILPIDLKNAYNLARKLSIKN